MDVERDKAHLRVRRHCAALCCTALCAIIGSSFRQRPSIAAQLVRADRCGEEEKRELPPLVHGFRIRNLYVMFVDVALDTHVATTPRERQLHAP